MSDARSSVGGAKALEHREMLEIARRQRSVDLLDGRGYREVGDPDTRVAAPPTTAEISGAARHGFANRNPLDQPEQLLPGPPLSGAQALHHLDPADLRAGGPVSEAGQIVGRRLGGAEVIDEHAGVEDHPQWSKPDSRSASRPRTLST